MCNLRLAVTAHKLRADTLDRTFEQILTRFDCQTGGLSNDIAGLHQLVARI